MIINNLFFEILFLTILSIKYVASSITNTSSAIESALKLNQTNNTAEYEKLFPFEDVDPTNPIFIFMCIVYILSTLSAIISNLMVILVYKFGYRTSTDLSLFLVNLAIADFLMSTVCMPFTFAQALLKKWIFGDIMCPIVLFKQVLAVSLSIYTLVAIGIDRYMAIRSPLKNRVIHRKSKLVILLVWIISISLASVQLFVARVETVVFKKKTPNATNEELNNSSIMSVNNSIINLKHDNYEKIIQYQCNEIWNSDETRQAYTLFNFFAVYLIPVFMLAYTYTCIACIIKSTTHPGNADACRDQHYNKSKRKVIKMLIVLVCAFTLCWGPLHLFTLMKDFTQWLDMLQNDLWIYYAVHWLAMANCTINPFIYGYSSKKFRSDVYSLILCCNCFNRKLRRSNSTPTNTAAYIKKWPKQKNVYYNSRRQQKTNNNNGASFYASVKQKSDYNFNVKDNNLKEIQLVEISKNANNKALLNKINNNNFKNEKVALKYEQNVNLLYDDESKNQINLYNYYDDNEDYREEMFEKKPRLMN